MVPWLAGSVDIDIAEYVHNRAVLEQLDGVVAVDAGGTRRVVGSETEEVVEADCFRGDVDKFAGYDGICREARF